MKGWSFRFLREKNQLQHLWSFSCNWCLDSSKVTPPMSDAWKVSFCRCFFGTYCDVLEPGQKLHDLSSQDFQELIQTFQQSSQEFQAGWAGLLRDPPEPHEYPVWKMQTPSFGVRAVGIWVPFDLDNSRVAECFFQIHGSTTSKMVRGGRPSVGAAEELKKVREKSGMAPSEVQISEHRHLWRLKLIYRKDSKII